MATPDQQIRRELVDLGYELVRHRKHEVWRHPNGAQIAVPLSMGRGRAYWNMRALARRLAKPV